MNELLLILAKRFLGGGSEGKPFDWNKERSRYQPNLPRDTSRHGTLSYGGDVQRYRPVAEGKLTIREQVTPTQGLKIEGTSGPVFGGDVKRKGFFIR